MTSFQLNSIRQFLPKAARLICGLGCAFSIPGANAQNAPAVPNAGGYAGDFGSDFGVGKAEPTGLREPVAVAGLRSLVYGKPVPWLGLRFADELAEELRSPMRKSVDASAVAQFLAARRIASWRVAPNADSATPSAASALRTWRAYRNIPLIVVGEITVSGKDSARETRVLVRLRVLRWEKSTLRAAAGDVSFSATLGEWPQLPARAALALVDALRIPLIEDERIDMLRRASPLQPPATAQQLRWEKLAGEMQYQALRCQILTQPLRGELPYAKAARVKNAKSNGVDARRSLAMLKKIKIDGSLQRLRETPRRWQAYVSSVSSAAESRFQALPPALRKPPPVAKPKA